MNYKVYGIAVILALSCIGCYSIRVNKATMHTSTTNPVALGVIGVQEDHMRSSDFKVFSIPGYEQKIRVGILPVDFNTATFETYMKASKGNAQSINYVDSLDVKPRFVTVELLDRVSTIAELQEEYNTQTLAYLKSQKEAAIVTSVSMALPESFIQEMNKAEAVFLNNGGYKQYQLSLIKEGKPYKTINFAEVTIFAYELSFFCWGENDRKQITIADIIDEKSPCSRNTYRDAGKAREKMNYFKL